VTLAPPPERAFAPPRSDLMAPFWEGCARRELVVQRCPRCGLAVFPAAHVCPRCRASGLAWERTRPTGTIYTFTTVSRGLDESFAVPYVVAWIDMDDGWQLLSWIVGCEAGDVEIGAPVTATFVRVGPDERLPVFELLNSSEGRS
jgi:uncharacterized OB-fold protein